jgi:TonB family protein
MAACIEGTAIVNFYIGVDGKVSDVRFLQSTGNPDLDEATESCVTNWRYKPALQNGTPIGVRKEYKIAWTLGDYCASRTAAPTAPPKPNSPTQQGSPPEANPGQQ